MGVLKSGGDPQVAMFDDLGGFPTVRKPPFVEATGNKAYECCWLARWNEVRTVKKGQQRGTTQDGAP